VLYKNKEEGSTKQAWDRLKAAFTFIFADEEWRLGFWWRK